LVFDKPELKSYEIAVHRELEKTLFDANELDRKIFNNDFEKYFAARMDMDEYLKVVDNYCNNKIKKAKKNREDYNEFEEEEGFEFEMPLEDFGEKLSQINPQDSDIYEVAFKWSLALHRWMGLQYENPEKQNKDSCRVLTNCTMVCAKVAYAGFMPSEDLESSFDPLDSEVSKDGLILARTFLSRTLESLNNLLSIDGFDNARLLKFIDIGKYLHNDLNHLISD